MVPLTTQERILEELRHSSRPLDDDELAHRLSISPRQAINQACHKLQRAGRLRRYKMPGGKIVNDLGPGTSSEPSASRLEPVAADPVELSPGDSREQRHAERLMLEMLGRQLGVLLAPRRIVFDNGVRVEVDGADQHLTVLVEAWAHQGKPKSAQKHKILADTLKLLYVASTLPVSPRLVLCLADPDAAHHFTAARSWAALTLRDFGIEVCIVALPDEIRAAIRTAQERQFR